MIITTEVLPKHVCTVVSSADDGESSVSSTVTVVHTSVEVVLGDQPGKGFHHHSPPTNGYQPKKSVRFDESQNKIYRNYTITKKDCQGLWYSSKDYTMFKAGTKCMAKEISRFEKLNKAPHSYERVMTRAYLACVQHPCESTGSVLDSEEEKHMKKWMEISINRLGVERISIRQIARDRAARRSQMTLAVFKLQELASHHHHHDYYSKAELIRRACMTITRPSRLFARQLAHAQSESLQDEIRITPIFSRE